MQPNIHMHAPLTSDRRSTVLQLPSTDLSRRLAALPQTVTGRQLEAAQCQSWHLKPICTRTSLFNSWWKAVYNLDADILSTDRFLRRTFLVWRLHFEHHCHFTFYTRLFHKSFSFGDRIAKMTGRWGHTDTDDYLSPCRLLRESSSRRLCPLLSRSQLEVMEIRQAWWAEVQQISTSTQSYRLHWLNNTG